MNKRINSEKEKFNQLIKVICTRLSQGKRVRRNLPGGRIHIDRPMPFLFVYRQPVNFKDEGTERLVMGEAAYLIVTSDPQYQQNLEKLLENVIKILSTQFGAFLLLELWAEREKNLKTTNGSLHSPMFKILTENTEFCPYTPMLAGFANFLKKIRILKINSDVTMCFSAKLTPQDLPLLIKKEVSEKYRAYTFGISVNPIYRSQKNGKLFPLVLRSLHRGLSKALKQLCFNFVKEHTTHQPSNYNALGRRAVVKAVWEIDSKLAEVSNAFDFLFLITPVNSQSAWNQFKSDKFNKIPKFYYRPLPIDPALVKRKLFNIPIERIEDPTLADLFREKQFELEHRLNMLIHRGTKRFLFSNLQLYGKVDNKITVLAENILNKIPLSAKKDNLIGSNIFFQKVNDEISYYKRKYPMFDALAEINETIPGILVVGKTVYIGKNAKISESRINALIQHEVGTHLVTYYNGREQPFKQLYSGLAGYEELQEGLALFAEFLSGELTHSRLRTVAARVIASRSLTDGNNFVETFYDLVNKYSFDKGQAFRITFRTYRAGGSIKDIIYLRGLQQVLEFIKNGGDLDLLFIGKFGFNHVPVIKELVSRKILSSSVIRPRFLSIPGVKEKLESIQRGIEIYNLPEEGLS